MIGVSELDISMSLWDTNKKLEDIEEVLKRIARDIS